MSKLTERTSEKMQLMGAVSAEELSATESPIGKVVSRFNKSAK